MNVAIRTPQQPLAGHSLDPQQMLTNALFRTMGIDGVYARTALYEGVIERLQALISKYRDPSAEVLRFPPVMSRRDIEKAGYLKSFPNLLGCVCAMHGSEADISAALNRSGADGDWTNSLAPADLVLSPAACYPIYPLAAAHGPVPCSGRIFDVACDCFRREPSRSLDRLQSFRMREYVCIGSPEAIVDFRARWIDRAKQLAERLGLVSTIETASDPFFGREGRMMAVSQIQQALKFELLVPIISAEQPTACMSFNYHREHFGTVWKIHDETGAVAHSGCVAFGMDRLAVALFTKHGVDAAKWPPEVRELLAL